MSKIKIQHLQFEIKNALNLKRLIKMYQDMILIKPIVILRKKQMKRNLPLKRKLKMVNLNTKKI